MPDGAQSQPHSSRVSPYWRPFFIITSLRNRDERCTIGALQDQTLKLVERVTAVRVINRHII